MAIFTQEIYDAFKGVQMDFEQTQAFFDKHKVAQKQRIPFYIKHARVYSVDAELVLKHVEECKGDK